MQTVSKCQKEWLSQWFWGSLLRHTHTSHSEHQDTGAAEMLFSLARWARFSHCHRTALNYLTGPYGGWADTLPCKFMSNMNKYKATNMKTTNLRRKHSSRAGCGGTDLQSQEVKATRDPIPEPRRTHEYVSTHKHMKLPINRPISMRDSLYERILCLCELCHYFLVYFLPFLKNILIYV